MTVVAVEGAQRPTVLALILGGRMHPDTGETTLDGRADARGLRRAVALVDAPDVSAPADDLPLAVVLHEELAFAGVRGARRATRRMLADLDLVAHRATPMGELPADIRVRALAETAAQGRGVEALVLVSPDRHGGDPGGWHDIAVRWADRGFAVVVLAGAAAAAAVVAPDRVAEADGQVHEDVRPASDDAPTLALPIAAPVHVSRVGEQAPAPDRAREQSGEQHAEQHAELPADRQEDPAEAETPEETER
ncbi:hypothetical protein GCM10023351_08900 [Microbacterium gilvum]|uniref:Uncharacterized protein n=1 Tax=Microbacterium gilvum TaxID=1336204 RepID=A0ABP8ZW76_9MICO